MSNKYKVGDKVKVIGNGHPTLHYVTIGSVATVVGISDDSVDVVGISSSHGGSTHQTVSIPDITPVIDFYKPVQTVAGEPVTIISREGRNIWKIVGYRGNKESLMTWTEDGRWFVGKASDYDLINVEEKPKEVVIYINQDSDGNLEYFDTREGADKGAFSDRIARKRVVIVAGEFDE